MSFRPATNTDIKSNTKSATSPIKAYVINADKYKKEYKILNFSKKYQLVSDSAAASVQLQLKEMECLPLGCITPQFTVQLLTLGLCPVIYPERYKFKYDEIIDKQKKSFQQDVELERVVSWFHLFSFKKNRKKAIGKTLSNT